MMNDIPLPPLERRLQKRYLTLVHDTIKIAKPEAPGLVPRGNPEHSPFAATQAVYRFLNNDRITLEALAQPLREAGVAAILRTDSPVALVIHDWSKLKFGPHSSKKDTFQRTHKYDTGYELSMMLLVSGDDGLPVAPMEASLLTANGLLSTNPNASDEPHLNQLLTGMNRCKEYDINKTMVHIVDREADSVYHYRLWDEMKHLFLVRGDDRIVRHRGKHVKLSEIMSKYLRRGRFTDTGRVKCKGKHAICSVCEESVVLDRPAHIRIDGRPREVSGKALTLRFVMTILTDEMTGKVLATWYLLTNVSHDDATTEMISQWYYWRWRIENFFKLLKGHGFEIDRWQQKTGLAIARRLLVSSMACVAVWELMDRDDEDANRMKDLLIQLSGRQMKRGVRFTAPALLAGMFVLLPILALLDEEMGGMSITDLRQLARRTIPLLNTEV